MSAAVATPKEVLNNFSKDNLAKFYMKEFPGAAPVEQKKKLVERLSKNVEELGIKQITAQLKKTHLEEIVPPLKLDLGENNNPHSGVVLQRRLAEAMAKEGITQADFVLI